MDKMPFSMTVGIWWSLALLMMAAPDRIVAFPMFTRNVSRGDKFLKPQMFSEDLSRKAGGHVPPGMPCRAEDQLPQGSAKLRPATLLLSIQANNKFNTPAEHKSYSSPSNVSNGTHT